MKKLIISLFLLVSSCVSAQNLGSVLVADSTPNKYTTHPIGYGTSGYALVSGGTRALPTWTPTINGVTFYPTQDVAVIGTSVSEGIPVNNAPYATYIGFKLPAPFSLDTNLGVAGQNSTQILARVAEVTGNSQVSYCIIEMTANDIIQNVKVLTTEANIQAFVNDCNAANIKPITIDPIPMNNMTALQSGKFDSLKTWMASSGLTGVYQKIAASTILASTTGGHDSLPYSYTSFVGSPHLSDLAASILGGDIYSMTSWTPQAFTYTGTLTVGGANAKIDQDLSRASTPRFQAVNAGGVMGSTGVQMSTGTGIWRGTDIQIGTNSSLSFNTTGQFNIAIGYKPLYENSTGNNNIGIGEYALYLNQTQSNNIAIGTGALYNNHAGHDNLALGSNAEYMVGSGYGNIAMGSNDLQYDTSGYWNLAMGYGALVANTTGYSNVADGTNALNGNMTGYGNIAIGTQALPRSTTQSLEVAIGYQAMYSTNPGTSCTAIGVQALYANTGSYNTAIGSSALSGNTSGTENTATAFQGLSSNTTGSYNNQYGVTALISNSTGKNNNAFGVEALGTQTTASDNTAFGHYALKANTASQVTAHGDSAGVNNTTGTDNDYFGYNSGNGNSTGSYGVYLGDGNITSINAEVTSISAYSDKRIKYNIKTNVIGLSFILKLKPVTYFKDKEKEDSLTGVHYDGEKDTILHSGLLAQDVEKAANSVGYNFEGVQKDCHGVYKLAYGDLIPSLIQAIKDQQKEINSLKNQVKKLQKNNIK